MNRWIDNSKFVFRRTELTNTEQKMKLLLTSRILISKNYVLVKMMSMVRIPIIQQHNNVQKQPNADYSRQFIFDLGKFLNSN